MPSVRITAGTWAERHADLILTSVRRALVLALEVPEDDQDIALHVLPDRHFSAPSRSRHAYARIEVMMLAGRDIQVKRRLFQLLADVFDSIGEESVDVKAIIHEIGEDNVAQRRR